MSTLSQRKGTDKAGAASAAADNTTERPIPFFPHSSRPSSVNQAFPFRTGVRWIRNLVPKGLSDVFGSTDPIHTLILSVFLGVLIGLGFGLFLLSEHLRGFGLFMVAFGWFHVMEYVFVARFHPEKLCTDSFLLNHGFAYSMAFLSSIVEFFVELYFFPSMKSFGFVTVVGIILTFGGHFVRVTGQFHGKKNFTHLVSESKVADHTLVTDGIYSIMRHPGYFGFFWWSVGSQVLMFNPICIVGFFAASWFFFYERIPEEEKFLVDFFGADYVNYRKRVATYIPFIP